MSCEVPCLKGKKYRCPDRSKSQNELSFCPRFLYFNLFPLWFANDSAKESEGISNPCRWTAQDQCLLPKVQLHVHAWASPVPGACCIFKSRMPCSVWPECLFLLSTQRTSSLTEHIASTQEKEQLLYSRSGEERSHTLGTSSRSEPAFAL